VLVEATVKDKSGKIVAGLQKEDFRVFEEGQLQTIAHFSQDQIPLAVALVVDLSGSIEPFLRPLRYASSTALKTLKREDEVALFTFSGGVDRVVDLTRDKRRASDHIELFVAGGRTNINQALYDAATYLEAEAPAARRVIILVSDMVPTESGSASPQQITATVLQADAAVYGLKVPGRNPMAARAASAFKGGLVNVAKLAEESGGEVFNMEKEGSLFLAFQTLIERLKTRYTLGFYPANKTRDGTFRRLEVKLHDKGYRVLAKRGYYAPRR